MSIESNELMASPNIAGLKLKKKKNNINNVHLQPLNVKKGLKILQQ